MTVTDNFPPRKRPPIEETLMHSAQVWARRSTCDRNNVGVVIASADNRILCTGYNGAPSGMPHCDHRCNCENKAPYRRVQLHATTCATQTPCKIAVHGEANAIAFAARNGIALAGARLFSTLTPCYACAQLIINAGIVEVQYLETYRSHEGQDLLRSGGLSVVKFGT